MTDQLIEIAKECGAYVVRADDYHFCEDGEAVMAPGQLQQFAKRIEAPHRGRINRLIDKLNSKDEQIEQLREALQLMVDTHEEGGWPTATIVIARKALEG